MALQLRKAERKKAKLRIGISAPSGAGKTYSALLLAYGMTKDWSKIALVDTENGSGELYSHLGEYNTITLEAPFTPEKYIEAIKMCESAGMELVIIDSVSHEWDGKGGLLESNELLAQTKFKGNSWAAWSVTTPKHQKFIESITTSICHIITTARSKTDTIQTEDKKIKKVGLKDIQREGFEYELTVNFNIDRDGHYATASKDRTGMFIDRDPFVITEKTGEEIINWANSGVQNLDADKLTIKHLCDEMNPILNTKEEYAQFVKDATALDLNDPKNFDEIISKLTAIKDANDDRENYPQPDVLKAGKEKMDQKLQELKGSEEGK